MAPPHPDCNNLNNVVWSPPLYIPGKLPISFLSVLSDLCFMQDRLCLQECPAPLHRVKWILGLAPPQAFLSSCHQPVYPAGDISGIVVSLGSNSSPKAQGWDLVPNCAAVWFDFCSQAFYCFFPPEQLTKGLVEGFISRPQLQGWSRNICVLSIHAMATSRK